MCSISLVTSPLPTAALGVLHHQHAEGKGLGTLHQFCVQLECNNLISQRAGHELDTPTQAWQHKQLYF